MIVSVPFRAFLCAGIFIVSLSAQAAFAETLKDAFRAAYERNPTILAERAKLRATDELVPQALSGWRPTITGQASVDHIWSGSSSGVYADSNHGDVTITLSQPLFRGFKTVEGTKQAEAQVKAERQNLLVTEQQVLLSAVTAYANVVRDRQLLTLRRKNVGFLQKQLGASDARFKAGELTRTDVAQTRASLSGAQAQVAVAQSQLAASEANYATVVGKKPSRLVAPPTAGRPSSLAQALAIAQETNPLILSAAQTAEAFEHNIEVIKGDLLPSLSMNGTLDHAINSNNSNSTVDSARIQGVLNVPLYEGGLIYSKVRAAKETASQNKILVIGQVRSVRESVTIAWNNLISGAENLASTRVQLSASQLALDGVQQEFQVGSRTTIDVLNSQQTLLGAQLTEVVAIHDLLLASYQLQSAMGRLTARQLGLGGYYNPNEHYNDVRDKWIGLSAEDGNN